jgi:hypothetical protein
VRSDACRDPQVPEELLGSEGEGGLRAAGEEERGGEAGRGRERADEMT